MLLKLVRRLKLLLQLAKFKQAWRKQNPHNYTSPRKIFPMELLSIGRRTYGIIDVDYYKNKNEGLKIGNFVSISNDVLIF